MRGKFTKFMFRRVRFPFRITRKKRRMTGGFYHAGKGGMPIRTRPQWVGKAMYDLQNKGVWRPKR